MSKSVKALTTVTNGASEQKCLELNEIYEIANIKSVRAEKSKVDTGQLCGKGKH